ncbi:MAG: ribonuclease J [Coriobacteriales bacterium]|jgi:ribonuclease J|nr:ribonuclease J [Coriobacteriales bacterium]
MGEGRSELKQRSTPRRSERDAAPARSGRRVKGALQAKDALKIIPLGGLDGIGKNMTCFEYHDEMMLVDAGLMFPDDDHPGVDLILPDYSYVLENARKLKGIVITHGHEDHTGALPYLIKDLGDKVPIYASDLTLGFIKGKFEEFHIRNIPMRKVTSGHMINLGCFKVHFFRVTHSIPGAFGVFIESPAGNVMMTGDFKLDQTPIDGQRTDFAAISRFADRGIDLLMSDSTNSRHADFTQSEATVGPVLRDITMHAKRKVIVASFASHIHRMQQICDAAVAAGRKVAVTGRSMLTNSKIARDLGYLNIKDKDIIDAYDIKKIPPHKLLVLCTGSQGEPLSALARMAAGEHRTVDIESGDTVIISANPVPGNEKAVTRVINELAKIGADVYDKSRAHVHVSGHGGSEELKIMLSLCHPRNFMPVHGESQHLRAHAQLAEAIGIPSNHIYVEENGEVLLLKDGQIKESKPVESGIIYVDGLSVGDLDEVVLKDRQTLSSDGFVTVVCMLKAGTGKSAGEPEVIMKGVAGGDDPALVSQMVKIADDALKRSAGEKHANENRIKRGVRDGLSKFLWQKVKRRPMIIPILMEV